MEELQEKTEEEIIEDDSVYELIGLNDDINTFGHVITSLMEVCQVDIEHATKCAYNIHHSGEAIIVEGEKDKMEIMMEGLNMLGIDATVRKQKKEE